MGEDELCAAARAGILQTKELANEQLAAILNKMFIDTHTHLYDDQYLSDERDMIYRALDAGVKRMYMPNCSSETLDHMLHIADRWPKNCFPMMGLHPTYVKDNYKEELNIAEQWLAQRKFYAIGEVGLDYYWDMTYKDQQIEAFSTQVDWALKYRLPVVIHSRESIEDCIRVISGKQDGTLTGIFHCFSGTLEEAQKITSLNFYLGIGGVTTYKKSNLPDVIKAVPVDRLVLETDAPYLAPAPYRGKRNESSYLPLIAEKIAEIKGMTLAQVAAATTANAEKIFGIAADEAQ